MMTGYEKLKITKSNRLESFPAFRQIYVFVEIDSSFTINSEATCQSNQLRYNG